MNQGFWMPKGSGGVNGGEMNYSNSSRMEQKRSHQWFVDGPEVELFPNKKQAVGVPPTSLFTGALNLNPFGNSSSFQSVSAPFVDRLFDSETARTVNFDDSNVPSVASGEVSMSQKLGEDPFRIGSSHGLSTSHALEHPIPGLNYGGIRKVKVSQVKESETQMLSKSVEHIYDRRGDNIILTAPVYGKASENMMPTGFSYNKGNVSMISAGGTYSQENNIFISMGQPYCKENDNSSISHTHRENSNIGVSMTPSYGRGNNSIFSLPETYDRVDEKSSSGQSYNKGEGTIISFGGCDNEATNPSRRLMSNYEQLVGQHSLQSSEVINERGLISNADAPASTTQIIVSGGENSSKKKEDIKMSKKAPPNSFPSNVRSLLSTGMLDDVPVKYAAWSREKELRGVIKGSGYLCGCQTCNFSKVINAYEFERHAGCKTKHPNNHIYFENGKSIYGIVQELRNTPQDMLFDVIQTIFGSPINQKSFRQWKESFLAATRELQRIYGKDEGQPLL